MFNNSNSDDNKMRPKTFKARPWMIAAIHASAHQQDISDGEWLRRTILDALVRQGYNPDDYFNAQNTNPDHQ